MREAPSSDTRTLSPSSGSPCPITRRGSPRSPWGPAWRSSCQLIPEGELKTCSWLRSLKRVRKACSSFWVWMESTSLVSPTLRYCCSRSGVTLGGGAGGVALGAASSIITMSAGERGKEKKEYLTHASLYCDDRLPPIAHSVGLIPGPHPTRIGTPPPVHAGNLPAWLRNSSSVARCTVVLDKKLD